MGVNLRELSFEFKSTFIPKTISQFIKQVSMIDNVSDRILELDDYVYRLENEMGKIAAFQRELPLCMFLINDAILVLKEAAIEYRKQNSEPVLEEFIPLKKSCDESGNDKIIKDIDIDIGDKKNWLSSTQLWKTDDDDHPNTKSSQFLNTNSVLEIKKKSDEGKPLVIDNLYQPCKPSGRAFMSFKGYSPLPAVEIRKEGKEELPGSSGLSLITPGIKNKKEESRPIGLLNCKISSTKPVLSPNPNVQSSLHTAYQSQLQHNSRKQRRCWSPELHKRFVNALQELGGSQAATPKQIREHMQVDGLTNDEVKSHLQKYRLHTRKLPNSTTGGSANQPPVVLGGSLWMGQDQCSEAKQSKSRNGSPQGPLQLNGPNGGTSTIGGESMEEDDGEEDEKSESYCWKSHTHTSGNDDL